MYMHAKYVSGTFGDSVIKCFVQLYWFLKDVMSDVTQSLIGHQLESVELNITASEKSSMFS